MTAKFDEPFTQRLLCIAPLVFGGLFLEGEKMHVGPSKTGPILSIAVEFEHSYPSTSLDVDRTRGKYSDRSFFGGRPHHKAVDGKDVLDI